MREQSGPLTIPAATPVAQRARTVALSADFRQTGAVPSSSESLLQTEIAGHSIACAHHEAAGATTVIFCHGFRGEKTGPNRTFVRAARLLAASGISSLRFDQYGSGDSEGDFFESRFDDWVNAIDALTHQQLERGQRVALLGQSMGASAVICAASALPVEAVVAWVPDTNIDDFTPGPEGFVEEGGQRVSNAFWEQAYAADVARHLAETSAPSYLVFGTADEYVSTENREALVSAAGPNVRIDVFDGYPHSAWTAEQAEDIIQRSVGFLAEHLRAGAGQVRAQAGVLCRPRNAGRGKGAAQNARPLAEHRREPRAGHRFLPRFTDQRTSHSKGTPRTAASWLPESR